MGAEAEPLRIALPEGRGEVSGLWLRPPRARALLVLAHGAGADMWHAFMQAISEELARRGLATLRYQFPYSEAGRRRPDRAPALTACVRAAVSAAAQRADGLPLLAGGKSMGGRMTSLAASEAPLPGVRGLVFLGFPLHAAGRPRSERGAHLAAVDLPLLFLQGTRDRLADLALLRPLARELGGRATLHEVEDGDHSFRVPRRSVRSDDEVLAELGETVDAWSAPLLAP